MELIKPLIMEKQTVWTPKLFETTGIFCIINLSNFWLKEQRPFNFPQKNFLHVSGFFRDLDEKIAH